MKGNNTKRMKCGNQHDGRFSPVAQYCSNRKTIKTRIRFVGFFFFLHIDKLEKYTEVLGPAVT